MWWLCDFEYLAVILHAAQVSWIIVLCLCCVQIRWRNTVMWYPVPAVNDANSVYTAGLKGFRAVPDSTRVKVKLRKAAFEFSLFRHTGAVSFKLTQMSCFFETYSNCSSCSLLHKQELSFLPYMEVLSVVQSPSKIWSVKYSIANGKWDLCLSYLTSCWMKIIYH